MAAIEMNAISEALIHISSVSSAWCSFLIMKYSEPGGDRRRHHHQPDGTHDALSRAESISAGRDKKMTTKS